MWLLALGLGGSAAGQSRPTRPDANGPKRVDTSPFRRIDLGELRVEVMALNDEACPVQLLAGRVAPTAGRHHGLWVDVKSVWAAPLGSFSLVTFVFDAAGRLKETRETPDGPLLAPYKRASLELALDYARLSAGDWLVVAVKRVGREDGDWRSDGDELISVATAMLRREL